MTMVVVSLYIHMISVLMSVLGRIWKVVGKDLGKVISSGDPRFPEVKVKQTSDLKAGIEIKAPSDAESTTTG